MPALDLNIVNELKELMEGDLSDIIDMFITDSHGQVASMQAAIDSNKLGPLIDNAHTLKSSSANLGALVLSGYCEQMEHDCRKNTLDNPKALLDNIIDELARVETELKQFQ